MILAQSCSAAGEGFQVLINALGALKGIGLAVAIAAALAVIAFGFVVRAISAMGGGGEKVGSGKRAIMIGLSTLALVALFPVFVPTIEALLGRSVSC